ncbi:hypothetical protein [Rhizobium sp. Leaf386]|uniref:hypothetical protein n=1 Tax=Rhizobium sp. Leaf386 TaxID=1736359 RepID=UPI00071620EC|nr:hypothetical protein [Rhizobium sp. Leaf386]KQS90304.1 hypothetical protein ASG50_07555 [Rhizobium sp. Leaf386]
MKYTVTGTVAEFGAGQKMKLTAQQIDARRHGLSIEDEDRANGKVTATGILTFKRGEEIDIPEKQEDLPRYLADTLTPSTKAKKQVKDDGLQAALDAANKAYAAALSRHNLPGDRELTADEAKLVAKEATARADAQAALDAAN